MDNGLGEIMPDRKKTKTTVSYSSKDRNTDLANFLDWFFNFLAEMSEPPKERTLERQSSRDFFYRALAVTSKFALIILVFFVFFALSLIEDEGVGLVLVILSGGILTSITFFFFLSIASIGFSLREMEDKVTTQNTMQEKQIRLIEKQLEIQKRLLEIQLEMREDSQKD